MKGPVMMQFLSGIRSLYKPVFTDDTLALYLDAFTGEDSSDIGASQTFSFIIRPAKGRQEIGRISLRYGESSQLYYFGHIGYHIDEPYRGHGYAAHACLLMLPLLQRLRMKNAVITTDVDNLPSRKTCEKLGCVLENIVDVPTAYQRDYELSPRKCRYIWRIPMSVKGKQ